MNISYIGLTIVCLSVTGETALARSHWPTEPAPLAPALQEIDFVLEARSHKPMHLRPIPQEEGDAFQQRKYRLSSVQRPKTGTDISETISFYRLKLSFEPSLLISGGLRDVKPATSIRDLHSMIAFQRSISDDMTIRLGTQIARLASYDGNVTTNGGKAYRDKTSDYFMPLVSMTTTINDRLKARFDHVESLRINMDTVILGPRAMPLQQWMTTGEGIDFQHRTANKAALDWQATEMLSLTAHMNRSTYRNRMMADHRGLLRAISGPSRTTGYGASLAWRLGDALTLHAAASREDISANSVNPAADRREKWALGIERQVSSQRLSVTVGQQDSAHFQRGNGYDFQPQWALEVEAEHPLPRIGSLPLMTLRMTARTAADMADGDSEASMEALASRMVQPQIMFGLSARW